MLLMDRNKENGYIYSGFSAGLGRPQLKKRTLAVFNVALKQTELNNKDAKVVCEEYKEETVAEVSEKTASQDFSFLCCLPPWFTDNGEKICKPSTHNISANFEAERYLFHLRGKH